jgi:phosphonate transport system substrate-binding protein
MFGAVLEQNMKLRSLANLVFITLALFSGLTGISNVAAQSRETIEVKTLTLGIVSETHQKQIEEHFQEFVLYVTRKLSSGGEIEAKVVTAATPVALAKLLEQGKVDFYMESVYPTYVINSVHGAGKLLLRRWKSGMPEYYSVIFTKRNGGIKRLEDLKGKTIVFEDAGSSSGYLMPKLFLQRRGLKLTDKANSTATDVGYTFAGSQDRVVDAVLTEQSAAGAFSSDDFAALDDRKKSEVAQLAQTDRLPRHLVSVRNDLLPGLVASLEAILLSMHDDVEGREILQRTDGTTQFDILPGGEAVMRRRLLETFYSPPAK